MARYKYSFIKINNLYIKDIKYVNVGYFTDDNCAKKICICFQFYIPYSYIKDFNIYDIYNNDECLKELKPLYKQYQYIIDIKSFKKLELIFLNKYIKDLNIHTEHFIDYVDIHHNLLCFNISTRKKQELQNLINFIIDKFQS